MLSFMLLTFTCFYDSKTPLIFIDLHFHTPAVFTIPLYAIILTYSSLSYAISTPIEIGMIGFYYFRLAELKIITVNEEI